MTLTSTSDRTSVAALTKPALLLIKTLALFAAYIVFAVATIAKTVTSSADLTPAQVDDLGASWWGLHVMWIAPSILAAVALALLARRLHADARLVAVLAGVAIACAVSYVLVNLAAYGSETATWGDHALYPWSVGLSLASSWFGTLPATVLVCIALARRGIAHRTAWTVAGLVGAYGVIEVLTYLPVLLGSETFAAFEGGLPPFLLGIFWALLGGGLLRARVPSQE